MKSGGESPLQPAQSGQGGICHNDGHAANGKYTDLLLPSLASCTPQNACLPNLSIRTREAEKMKKHQLKRRAFLQAPIAALALKEVSGFRKTNTANQSVAEKLIAEGKRTVKNPTIPDNWRDGPVALNNKRFNPYARSIPAIRAIYQRKRAVPHPAYAVMGIVLELRKPPGELLEDFTIH